MQRIALGGNQEEAQATLPGSYSMWVQDGKWFAAPTVDPEKFGAHDYAIGGYERGKRDCRCGCWMGDCRSSGPVDPFGACPANPKPTAPVESGTPAPYDYLRWHRLSEIRLGGEICELMAATSDEGIGVIARWARTPDGWMVTAIDSESGEAHQVADFHEGECVPPAPPVIWSDKLERETARLQALATTLKADLAALRVENSKLRAVYGHQLPSLGGWDNRCQLCGATTECGDIIHRADCAFLAIAPDLPSLPPAPENPSGEPSGYCVECSEPLPANPCYREIYTGNRAAFCSSDCADEYTANH